jgi:hypothetical protein
MAVDAQLRSGRRRLRDEMESVNRMDGRSHVCISVAALDVGIQRKEVVVEVKECHSNPE